MVFRGMVFDHRHYLIVDDFYSVTSVLNEGVWIFPSMTFDAYAVVDPLEPFDIEQDLAHLVIVDSNGNVLKTDVVVVEPWET